MNTACTEYNIGDGEDILDVPEPGYPTAVCSVNPGTVTPPFEAATWVGTESFDADGLEIIDYRWELVSAPDGNEVTLSSDDAVVTGFTPLLAGEYVGRLTVTNERNNSSTCEATLNAVPSQDLWVEMYWEHSGDDMDLHLLAPGGVARSSTDCYFANCAWGGLPWGQAGTGDDPALDLDDISGRGPENINIAEPQNGVYTVMVHDYPGSVYSGGNNVTVNVYLGGSLEKTDTRTITGEDSDNYFFRIDWTTKTVTGM